jgi:hypothetical protein
MKMAGSPSRIRQTSSQVGRPVAVISHQWPSRVAAMPDSSSIEPGNHQPAVELLPSRFAPRNLVVQLGEPGPDRPGRHQSQRRAGDRPGK